MTAATASGSRGVADDSTLIPDRPGDPWIAEYEAAAAARSVDAPASDIPSWRKPATAFAYLNFAEDAVWVTGPARAVLWALAKRVDADTGERYLYLTGIMERAGIRDRGACRRAIKTLCELGIVTVKPGRKRPKQVKPAPHLYKLHVPPEYRKV